jgi:hypothetical protein
MATRVAVAPDGEHLTPALVHPHRPLALLAPRLQHHAPLLALLRDVLTRERALSLALGLLLRLLVLAALRLSRLAGLLLQPPQHLRLPLAPRSLHVGLAAAGRGGDGAARG